MPQIFYNQQQYTLVRKSLRNVAPRAERLLWGHLKNKQLMGYKFRRQYGIGRFVVDFYCPELRLVIEIDGDTHFINNEGKRDRARQQYIERFGRAILRFLNTDVYENIDGVLQTIRRRIEELTSP